MKLKVKERKISAFSFFWKTINYKNFESTPGFQKRTLKKRSTQKKKEIILVLSILISKR